MPTPILVRDIMRVGVPTCSEKSPLSEAARLLVARNVSALIVLDEDGNMVGWVGEQHVAGAIDRDYSTLTAADVMDEAIPEVPPDVPAAAAAHFMMDRGLRQVFLSHNAAGVRYPAAVLTLQDVVRIVGGLDRAPGVGVGAERPSPIDLFKHRYGLA
ncbi:MAG: CBS domain-containing protein [Chloroflexota bacterium]|nr:CBS domain-containing protein [Chloroflexota bacterium]